MKRKIASNILFLFTIFLVSGCSGNKLNVKEEYVTREYGNVVSLKAEDYLDNDEKLLSKVQVSSDIKNEEETGHTAVGEYTLKFTYKKQEATVRVSVVDTVKPEFTDFKDTIEIYQNNRVDFQTLYAAEDLSEVVIAFDDSKVDYAVAGDYTVTVTATDSSGNTETKEIMVSILPVTVELDKTAISVCVGETVQLTANVNVPDAKATITSLNDTIASVDENGVITGVKAGEAIVTAELYGIKVECKVTVQTKPAKITASYSSGTNSGFYGSESSGSKSGSVDSAYSLPNGWEYMLNELLQATPTPQTSREAFELINAERVALGLEPAVWDAECERIALIRAQELSELDSVNADNAHAGFDKFQKENFALGECVAWGYTSALRAVNGWMNSPGHRNTLMREDRVYLAVAVCGTRWVAINSWSDQVEPW